MGVGRSATLQVSLPQPAPPGGLVVTVTSDATSVLGVAAPGTITIPQGQLIGQITVDGIAFGNTIVRANATGYPEATLNVSVVLNLISSPATLNVPFGQSTALPITIGPSAAPAGGLVLNVASSDPAIVALSTSQVTVPAGALSVNATVTGVAPGTVTITVSSPGYASSSTSVTSQANLNILQTSVSFANGLLQPTITVQLESAGSQIAASQDIQVNLSPANSLCVAVPASVTIPAGQVLTTFQPAYGGSATLPCTSLVTASAANLGSDTVSVTVNPTPGISVTATQTVGSRLQSGTSASLGSAQHGGVTVTIASNDPTRVLVSPDATTPGTASFTRDLLNGQVSVAYHVQGMENTTGSATVTISAPGFTTASQTVNVVPIGVEIQGLPTSTTSLSANDTTWYVRVGIPQTDGTALNTLQAPRAGGPAFVVTLNNSNAAVAQLSSDEPVATGQIVSKPIQPNSTNTVAVLPGTSFGLSFDPIAVGSTTVTVTGPSGVATMTTNGVRTVTVTGASINAPGTGTVGAGLQLPTSATLGASQHGGVTVTIASSDSSRVLVSPDAVTAGTASFTRNLLNGQTVVNYYLQGVENTTGSATVTISAPGFTSAQHTVNVATTGVEIQGLPTSTTSLSASDTTWYVRVGIPQANGTALDTLQSPRAGGPAFIVTLTNSNAAVAQLGSDEPAGTGQVVTKPIQSGNSNTVAIAPGSSFGLTFDPLAVGSTTVTVSGPPGVATMTTAGVRTVNVTGPAVSVSAADTVGSGLQTSNSATLGASQHGGVTVTVASSDPSRVRVSPNASTAGTASFTQNLANGQTAVAYYLQGMENTTGQATVTISAPGFTSGQQTVTVVTAGVEIQGLPTTTTTLSANDTSWYVRVGIPQANGTALNLLQAPRAGGPGFVVTLTNSNATVAQLASDEPAATGQSVTKPIQPGNSNTVAIVGGTSFGLTFDPLAVGSTTVTVTGPPGVATMTTAGVRTVTVTSPAISVPATTTVGSRLQDANSASLGASQHGGVTVTVSSSAPGVVLVAPNATTAGAASFTTTLTNGQTSVPIYVQGVENTTGTAIVTVSAPGFISATSTVSVVAPAVEIQGLVQTTTAGAANDTSWYVRVGLPNGLNTGLTFLQAPRAGGPPFVVTLSNSNAAVGQLSSDEPSATGQVVTKPIQAGNLNTVAIAPGTSFGLTFDPLAAGSTTVTVTGPTGVGATSQGVRAITVNP